MSQTQNDSLTDRYSPKDVEDRIYQWWEKSGFFKAQDQSTKPPFSIILPPPNVTGQLHMGHALDHTIQDVLIRWKRMSGFNAMWLPGTDHAGIATQSVVERELKKEGLTRKELGREKFVEKVWEWKQQYGDRIYFQMRKLGDSCDWDRAVFTLDEGVSKAVRKVFVDLYKKGTIYRGTRLVNWSTPLESAISDLEVEHRETKSSLYYINYPVEGQPGRFLTVATTRPETLLGDTAVAVHPDDDRYRDLVGKNLELPLTNRKIPVIKDPEVEMGFGSGVVKITPAHDFNDYKMGQRHKLPLINILEKNGLLNENAGSYKGLKVQEARKRVLEDLRAKELIVKEDAIKNSIGYCSRSGAVVEPLLSDQWFAKMPQLATAAKAVVETGTIEFEPEQWTKTYLHWMSIIEDWCISRQLWWGHRIPAWTCANGHVTVTETDPTKCETCGNTEIKQDEDVLDTWFSSALWPFSTMGWPAQTETLKTFYPTNVLVTGFDIIFFWVARMIMLGLEFQKDVPFRKVYIHGLIRDSEGKKMSKSTGNALDPVELIEEYGADALRFTLMAQIASGRDQKFSESRLEGYRNFMNKIWNATRFSLAALQDFEKPAAGVAALPNASDLSVADKWIIFETGQLEKNVEQFLEEDRFSDAANALYHFVWNEFCDWYLEFVKPVIYGEPSSDRSATQLVLAQTLNRMMRMLHPFTPFITEEIYSKLPIKTDALIVADYPTVRNDKTWIALGSKEAAFEMQIVKEVIAAIRNIRGELLIKPGVSINVRLAPSDARVQKILQENKAQIVRMAKLDKCDIGDAGSLAKCAVTPIRLPDASIDVIVPLEGLVDIEEEVKRIKKAVEKSQKDVAVLSGKLSNENFVKNAPPELLESDKALLETVKERLARLQDSLTRLS
ncbi:MAG TPA: valine--tRNA ligase [Bdellovibrionales bacterium]|nr:valine--tRNA ligase [Bdellovibrionales bacterium]